MNDNGFLIPVFLSHSINDKQIAGKIKKKLSNFGVDKELSHTVSIRISLLLGKNEFDTECVRKFIRDVYSVRSGIVHGEDYLKRTRFPLHWLQIKLKRLVNQSILAYIYLIKQGKTVENIKGNLDESISSPNLEVNFKHKHS